MSVIAIHPRTHSPAAPSRTGSSRRRPSSAPDAPVLRVTVDVPLVGDRLSPELSVLLELVRELVDRSEGALAVSGLTTPPTPVSAAPAPAPVPVSPNRGVRDVRDRAEPAGFVGTTDVGTAGLGVVGAGPGGDEQAGSALGGAAFDGAVDTDDARILRVLSGPRLVLRGGQPVPFTRLEFDLLVFLARHPRRVFTRPQLLSNVWGYEHAVARTVDVHVRRLRAKAGDGIPVVTTVHGVGYRLADDAPVRIDDSDADGGWGPRVSLR